MRFEPLTARHCLNLGPLAPIHTGFEIDADMAARLEQIGGVAAVEGEAVLAIGGIVPRWEGVGMAWAWLSQGWKRHARAITYEVARNLSLAPYRRIEAAVLCDYAGGHRWIKRLGFELETPCARNWGDDGRDYSLYVRLS